MSAELHVNDFGTVLTFTFLDESNEVVPLAGLTSREIIFKKPDGTRLSKTPSLTTDGSDGKVYYTLASGDFDVKGMWQVQGRAANASSNYYSDVLTFKVFENI
jgi:hypothetical protein